MTGCCLVAPAAISVLGTERTERENAAIVKATAPRGVRPLMALGPR
jgi:hypothetical protein